MSAITFSIIAIILYTTATTLQIAVYQGRIPQRPNSALFLGLFAVATHGAGIWPHLINQSGVDFSVINAQALVFLVISLVVTVFSQVKPVHNSKLIVFPITILSIVLVLNSHEGNHVVSSDNTGLLVHAALSVVAYAIFSLAAVQAGLLYAQNNQLKHHLTGKLVKALPPLQTTEALLFEMVWVGFVLLTLGILTGTIFVEDLFAQKVAHKTIFSILAWILFAVLIAARRFWGWRGLVAAKMTLAGVFILMLGFLGSKIVIEYVLPNKF